MIVERPKSSLTLQHSIKKKTKSAAPSTPVDEIRCDNGGYLPEFAEKQQRGMLCKTGYSCIFCVKCKVRLSFVTNHNCFKKFHGS